MADMNGQVALVTGGIRGIGLAICERLINRGVKVAAGYSSNRDAAQKHGSDGAQLEPRPVIRPGARKAESENDPCERANQARRDEE